MESADFEPKDWLRCNSCFILMRDSQAPFSFSMCSHIFCSKCVQKATKKCPQCQTQNIRVMPLVEPLNSEIKHCFESTEKLAEKYTQANIFQNQQLSINSNRLADLMTKKYANAKVEYQKISDSNKKLKNQIQELQSKIETTNRNISGLKNSSVMMTPGSNISSLTGNPKSVSSCGYTSSDSYERSKYYNKPTKVHKMDLDSELRIPSMINVPRSVGSSSRSTNSSRGTPFSNFRPFNHRR